MSYEKCSANNAALLLIDHQVGPMMRRRHRCKCYACLASS